MIFSEHQKAVFEFFEKIGIPEHHLLAYGSTLLISIAPFLLLFLFRVENTPAHKNYLRIALSFASGGLLGDAFIHLIPHAISPHHHHDEKEEHGHISIGHDHHHDHHHDHGHGHDHAHDHEHSHAHGHDHTHEHHHHHEHGHDHGHDHYQQTMVGLYIVCGIIFFFLMEKFIMFLKDGTDGHGHSHGGHSHSVGPKSKNKSKKSKKAKVSDDESSDDENDKTSLIRGDDVKSKNRVISGVLNLMADFLHNFTDGLAIGATFATGKSMGAVTAFSIFMHEIPHEIGDYAILIQAGYKRSSAISLQLVTALGAFIGTLVGLHFGTFDQATALILPLTAGGFIYIATVSVIPELLEKTNSYLQATLELVALLAGVGMMFFIALYE